MHWERLVAHHLQRRGIACALLGLLSSACGPQEPWPGAVPLEPVAIYDLDVSEASGLTLTADELSLYVVSDPGTVFHIDLQGHIISRLRYEGDDVEGVTYDDRDDTLWVVEEGSREVVHLSLGGSTLGRSAIRVPGDQGGSNKGLEGISLDPSGDGLLVVNENEPHVAMDVTWEFSVTNSYEFGEGLDYSGLCHRRGEEAGLWVLSDDAQLLFEFDPIEGVGRTFALPVDKPEGIAISRSGRAYLVSDNNEQLYVFDIPAAEKVATSPRLEAAPSFDIADRQSP